MSLVDFVDWLRSSKGRDLFFAFSLFWDSLLAHIVNVLCILVYYFATSINFYHIS